MANRKSTYREGADAVDEEVDTLIERLEAMREEVTDELAPPESDS